MANIKIHTLSNKNKVLNYNTNGINLIQTYRSKSNPNDLYLLDDGILTAISVQGNGDVQKKWDFNLQINPVSDLKIDRVSIIDDFVIVFTLTTLKVYKITGNGLQLHVDYTSLEKSDFDKYSSKPVYRNFLFGKFSGNGLVGIIYQENNDDPLNGIHIFEIDKSEINDAAAYPIYELEGDQKNPSIYNEIRAQGVKDVSVGIVKSGDAESFIIRDQNGLKVYRTGDEIELLYTLPGVMGPLENKGENELILFANITGQKNDFLDVVLRNKNGLYLYAYDNNQKVYKLINHNPMFSDAKGWNDPGFLRTLKTADTSENGNDDLIFTGPQGLEILSYDPIEHVWNTLLDTSKLPPGDRHARVLDVIHSGKITILTQNSNGEVNNWILEASPPTTIPMDDIEVSDKKSPKVEYAIPEHELESIPLQQELPLRDMIDYSFLKNNVETVSGKSKFSIPLMKSTHRYFNWFTLSYDDSDSDATFLGKGWSIPEQQIVVNDQGSVFPEDHRYYLVTVDNVLEMYYIKTEKYEDEEKETQSRMYFTLVGTDLLDKSVDEISSNIIYDVKEKKWTVKSNGNKYIYGTATGTGYDVKWENWRKRGRAADQQIQVPKFWNLVEIYNIEDEKVVTYNYEIVEAIADEKTNLSFTKGMYLLSIEDVDENKVEFQYENKPEGEIEKLEVKVGNLETFTVHTKYMTGYSLATDLYTQTIKFDYQVRGDQRYLTQITQEGENLPILKFAYNPSGFLQEIESPNNLKATMTLKPFTKHKTLTSRDIVRVEPIELESNIFHAEEYMVFAYLKSSENEAEDRKIIVKVFSNDAKKELFQVAPFGMNNVSEYRVAVTDNLFYVLLISKKNKKRELWIFHKNEDESWNPTPVSYTMGERALVRGGRDFVVYTDVILPEKDEGCYKRVVLPPSGKKPDSPQHLLVLLEFKKGKIVKDVLIDSKNLDPNKVLSPTDMSQADKPGYTIDGKFYPEEIKEEILLASTAGIFVHYADPYIVLHHRDSFGVWHQRPIADMGKQYRRTLDTFAKFDVNCDRKKFLMMLYKETALQMNDNIIISYRLMLDDKSDLFTNARVAVIGSDYKFRKREEFNQLKDHIESFSVRQDILEFTYKWHNETEQFKINVGMPEKKTLTKDDGDILKDVQEQMDHGFLLNIREYLATIESGKYTQNSTEIEFDGYRWQELGEQAKETKYPIVQKITDKYNLEQHQADGQIFLREVSKGGRNDVNLDINNLGMVVTSLPNYIAYKTERSGLQFQRFTTNGGILTPAETLPNETLSPHCNSKLIITYGNAGDSENDSAKTLIFRRVEQDIDTELVDSHTLSMNGVERKTRFIYMDEQLTGSNVFFPKVYVQPGSNVEKFGYIEQITDFNNKTLSYTNIRSSKGLIVKREQAEQPKKANEEFNKNILESTLFDKEKQVEIVQFFPYYQKDDEVDYFGFESYEQTQASKHIYDKDDVQLYKFPLTGIQYLQLSENKKFTSVYTPKNQDNVYKASSWIRKSGGQLFQLGVLSPNFKANIFAGKNYICSVLSKVKSRVEDWYLVEVIIDMNYLKEFDAQSQTLRPNIVITEENSSARTPLSNTELRIELSISTTNAEEIIDIDHILFAPVNLKSTINVYDGKLWTLTAQITSTGLVKKFLYDAYSNDLATVNEYNQVIEINSFTKLATQLLNGNRFPHSADITINGKRGIYESFSNYAYKNRWEIENSGAWSLFTNVIHHVDLESSDKIHLRGDFNKNSICLRFDYNLAKQDSKLTINDAVILEGNTISFGNEQLPIPSLGELIYVVEKDRVFVFVDGILYFDNKLTQAKDITLELKAFTSLTKLVILDDPHVSITYLNALGEELQKVHLIDSDKVVVRSYENDEIGRKIIETLPEIVHVDGNQPLLSYNPQITSQKVKHRRIVYQDDSLNEVQIMDIPNSEFTAEKGTGRVFLRNDKQDIPAFILDFYPIIRGYTYQVEQKGGGVRELIVYNNKRQKIAQYTYVPGVNGILSSYEYDEEGRLQTTLTPAYHKKARTTWRVKADNPRGPSVSPAELENYKKNLAFHFSYYDSGKPKAYQGPDAGKRLSIYNKQDFLKFFVTYKYKDDSRIVSVSYFNYDEINRLATTGYFANPESLTVDYLEQHADVYISKDVNPNVVEYQKFEYNDLEDDPYLRENVKRVVTLTKEYPFAEEFVTNMNKQTLTRRIYLPVQSKKDLQSIEITKEYTESGELVNSINYPYEHNGSPLKIQYQYNKVNQITGIVGPDGEIGQFEYNAEGGVAKEIRSPSKQTKFERNYKYNELGSFTEISDKFLDEELSYTKSGYGNYGFGDGTITQTKYRVKWRRTADTSSLKLNEQSFAKELGAQNSKACYEGLKKTGHINNDNYQQKIFYNIIDSRIPAICYENRKKISKVINERTFPKTYGHRYDFGNQKELTKGKYFVGNDYPVKPLQVSVLEKQFKAAAREIWNKLKSSQFIIEENLQLESTTAQARKGTESLVNPNLKADLKSVVDKIDRSFVIQNAKHIEQMILQYHLEGKEITLDELKQFLSYKKENDAVNKVWELIKSKYSKDPLNPKLKEIFNANDLKSAAKLLNDYFTTELLEDHGDVESSRLDEHGNHVDFFVGNNYRHLEYEENTNRVKTVYLSETSQAAHPMEHDNQGNVIKASHKNIERIEYDKVISKISEIRMTDGRVIKFSYDSRQDRIAKRVFGGDGKLIKEMNYIRDDNGKCLVQREVVYFGNTEPLVTMTAYIYGPKGGLIGFYRKGEFYNVMTDHEGSVRLIEKNGEIVAAYDYYPYGNTIRVFGKDPDAHIPYRYTGQEWDDETGLYYFIARYYDPEIGRFYQMDPMGQYFSPYKFSGNSPVSLVDPDGEFVFLLIVFAFLIVGAYLGGAAVNGNWNPLEWDWKSKETWLGIIGGGIVGATIPFFALQSVAVLAAHMPLWAAWGTVAALGVGFAYAEGVKYSGSWNPFEWDFTNPSLVNAIFTGFGQGTGFVYSVASVKSPVAFFKGLSTYKKIAFLGATAGNFGLSVYIEGSAMKWNFKDPQMYLMILTNAIHAHEGAMALSDGAGLIRKRFTSLKTNMKSLRTGTKKIGDYLNKDVGKKLLQYTGEVLSGVEVTASKAYDTFYAIDHDEVLWNLAGSRAYTAHVQGFLADQKLARRKWQAALFFVPGSHIKKVTSFSQLPTRKLVSNIITLFSNAQSGRDLNNGLTPVDHYYDNVDLDSSFAAKLIDALGDQTNLNNLQMIVYSNSDTFVHLVAFMNKGNGRNNLQIERVDDQNFNTNVLGTIDEKLNAIREECLKLFKEVAPQLKNDVKVTGFIEKNNSINTLIQKIERKIKANKPFVNSLNKGLKKILTEQTRKLNGKILNLRQAVRANRATDKQKQQLAELTKQRMEMGSVNERLSKIIDKHSSKLLDIEKILSNWIPEKGIVNKTIVYEETMLPVDYRPSDFVYDEGICVPTAKLLGKCNYCPETIAKNAHSTLNHLRWTSAINVDSIDTNQGLFFEPVNEWKNPLTRAKRSVDESKPNWIVSKLQSCLKYLNLTSNSYQDTPIWNNRPQIEQDVPIQSGTQFTTPDYSIADVNGTLFMLDMCVRKVTGEKYIGNGNQQISLIKAQEMSMNIIDEIEQMLIETVENEELLDMIDFPQLQCLIFETIARGTPSKIPTIIMDALEDIIDEMTPIEKEAIEMYFNKKCK